MQFAIKEILLGVPQQQQKCIVVSCRTMALRIFSIAKILEIKVLTITTSSDHVFLVRFNFQILFILLVKEDKSQLCGVLIHHAWI